MKFEETCDRLLKAARDWNDYHPMKRINLITAAVKEQNLAEDIEYFDGALAKLVADGFLTENPQNDRHAITPSGKVFSYTNSYVKQRREHDLEKERAETAYRKMTQEMRMRWVPHIIASMALVVATVSLYFSVRTAMVDNNANHNRASNSQDVADTLNNHK